MKRQVASTAGPVETFGAVPVLKFLLVEDNAGDARLIVCSIEDAYGRDHEIVQASTCAEALSLVRDQDFDIALVDYRLPDGLGVELIRSLSEEAPSTPTILLTGLIEKSVDLQAMAAGASDFISKDELSGPQFERAIRYSMERQRVENELRRSEAELVRRNDELSTAQAQLAAQTNNMVQLAGHLARSERNDEVTDIDPAKDRPHSHSRSLAEQSQICVWHVMPDGSGRHLNEPMAELLEISPDSPHSSESFLSFFAEASRAEAQREFENWTLGVATTFEASVIGRRTGLVRQLALSGSPLVIDANTPAGLLVTAIDITERRRIEASTKELARKDPLTGLLNRNSLNEQLTHALASANRIGRSVGVLCLDLDHFKTINDTQGHPFGDAILKMVAERLGVAVRASDSIARLGGDEFVVILNHLESSDLAAVPAQGILDSLAAPFCINGQTVFTGASIGIAIYPMDGNTPEDLLKKADMALYRSKEVSRGGYEFFDHGILENLLRRRELEPALRQAIQRDEMRLMYQPQVDIDRGDTIGVEALIRWESSDKGFLSPAEFIPLAESSGLIVPIGDWVLGEACRQLRAWQKTGLPDLRMSVNVSVKQLKRVSFVTSVMAALETTGVKPNSLILEVTEGGILEDLHRAKDALGTLSDLGVGIALDDFGTGFASLTLLKEFPVEQIKIDRSFIENVETDNECAAIAAATIALGHKLGLRVIGEGVETEEQLAFLRRESCEEAQGYYFGKPMWADDFVAWNSARARSGLLSAGS